ncbi:MAG: alpha/beta hydrolase [Thermomicrobiales bacterium]
MNASSSSPPDTVVFIHGLWMTPRSWEAWGAYYEDRGLTVITPSWPGLEGEVEALNRDPSPIGRLDLSRVVDHYAHLIETLPAPPIIIGHSLGGSVTQILLDRGLGRVGVCVASGTVKGIRDLPISTLRATSPALRNPFRTSPAPLSAKQFHYAFANTVPEEESNRIYRRYHIPGAPQVLRDVAFSSFHRHSPATVDFAKADRAPLLFIAFEQDHIVPPNASRHNAEKYTNFGTGTHFQEFPGRPHFPGVPGWEEVADFALEWATSQGEQETQSIRRVA